MIDIFGRIAGYCPDCGSILPPLRAHGDIQCYTCSRPFAAESLIDEDSTVKYSIQFNSKEIKSKPIATQEEGEEEGPTVERRCPRCGNEKMSYATLQLRSADEGQTVFYTCTNCKYKESENS